MSGLGLLLRSSGQRAILDALRVAGATSAAAAVPRESLGAINEDSLGVLVREGIVREGAPGSYYLYEPPPRSRERLVKMLVFWLIVILLPVVLIWLSKG